MNLLRDFFNSFWLYLLGLLVLSAVILYIGKEFPLVRYLFEEDGPKIELLSRLEGFGKDPQELHFKVEDSKSGLELIRVRVDQSRLNKEIYKLDVPLNTFKKEVKLKIDGKEEGFKPGSIRVTIEAFDRSFESNGEKLAFDVPVRFDVPKIEILTTQANAVEGGMEFVIYRVQADKVKQSGVRVGKKEFIGFPLKTFDKDFESVSGIYFSFFVIPFGTDDKKIDPVVYAKNSVGNVSTETFYYKILNQKERHWKYEVESLKESRFNQSSIGDYLSKQEFVPNKFWNERLSKPLGSQLSPNVGDILMIRDLSGKELTHTNEFLSFRYPSSKVVPASSLGKVVSLVEAEGFKKIVVIDHGFGLASVFSNLKEVRAEKNSEIGPEDPVGTASVLPQTGEGGYDYGLFYQGQATRAVEWWDQNWVRDHVLNKVLEVKKRLGINAPSAKPLLPVTEEEESSLPVIRNLEDASRNGSALNNKLVPSYESSSREDTDFERGRDF